MRGISSHSDRSVVLEVCQNSRQQRPDWHVGYRGQAPGLRTAGRGAGDGVHATTDLLPNRHRLLHLCRANSALAVILAA